MSIGNGQQQQQEQSTQLKISDAEQQALKALKKARARRSPFIKMEKNVSQVFEFMPEKSKIEEKEFNGKISERIAHKVIMVDDRDAGEKTFSVTFKQSIPIEKAFAEGHKILEIEQVGTGFELSYRVTPVG